MLTFHKLALTFLLTAGPFRLACDATVKPACESEGNEAAACCVSAESGGHARTTRSSLTIHVSHLQASAKASSCETMTSAPG